MTEERILLDNLHGKVDGLTALCLTLATAHPGSEMLLDLFKQQLKTIVPADASSSSDNYFLGLKEVHDRFEASVNQLKLDVALLAAEGSPHEH